VMPVSPRDIPQITALTGTHRAQSDAKNPNGYCSIGGTGLSPGDPSSWGSCPTGISPADE
jgi:hypothetical protein